MKKRIVLLNIFIVAIALLFSFISCDSIKKEKKIKLALELAEDNSSELQKVLDHYQASKDKLKLKAARFLIANMPYHGYKPKDDRFDGIFDSINEVPIGINRVTIFRRMLKAKYESIKPLQHIRKADVKTCDADFIIDNIDLAFKAWYRIPENKRASFKEFCNYILPYRSTNEPLIKNARLEFYQEYSWVYDQLDKGVAFSVILNKIILDFTHKPHEKISAYYPFPLSVDQTKKSRIGLCDDFVNYFVNLFRALGIVSAKDFVSQWGNHQSRGHSWLYFKYGDEEYAISDSGNDLRSLYRNESIPKVNRFSYEYNEKFSFSPTFIDVTSFYLPTTDVWVENEFKIQIETPLISVFDRTRGWEVVSKGELKENKGVFSNIGTNVLYMAGTKINNEFAPMNYPFFIDKNKEITYFKPKDLVLDSVPILRKYGLSSSRNKRKIDWLINLDGSVLQVSNDINFENHVVIYKIQNLRSTQVQEVEFKSSKKFKFIRFKSNNRNKSYLATLEFYDNKEKKLFGNVFKENITKTNKKEGRIDAILDNRSLTYSGGENFTIGVEFKKPKQISTVKFQARNDGNHIDKGNDYELFYWDKYWKPLGRQTANDTVLYYNIPKNSLLWLKNYTKGKEEHVFTIDENKRQKWLGFDNDF